MKRFASILLIAAASMGFFRWGVDIEVVCGTNITALTFGADSVATGGYDPYIDVPYFTIPGGGYGYFPIDDSLHPGYTMLSTDYRSPSHEKIVWGFYLETGANFVVRWELSDLPDSGEISIGAYNVDSLPNLVVDDWQDMRTVDSIAIFILGGQITAAGSPIFGIGEIPPPPNDFRIGAYPNPFNSAVSISVGEGLVPSRIEIFDIAGRMVAELSAEGAVGEGLVPSRETGDHKGCPYKYIWQPASSRPSGVYLVRARVGVDAMVTKRVVFLK
jgi:hypothetical protein